jgi:NitT/TauT family transport system permease protein
MDRVRIVAIQCLVVGLWLLGWELLARAGILDDSLFSTPSRIASEGWKLLGRGAVLVDLRVTLFEIVLGFALATVAGLVVGLIVAEIDALYEVLHLPILMLYALPTIALFPLFVLFCGIGTLQKVVFGASWGVFPVLVHTMAGRRAVSGTLLALGRSLGGSSRSIWWKIVLPSSLPLVATGLRLGMVYTILGVIVAELFMSEAGIGQRIVVASRHMQMATYFFYVAVISMVSIGLTYSVVRVERYFSAWRA